MSARVTQLESSNSAGVLLAERKLNEAIALDRQIQAQLAINSILGDQVENLRHKISKKSTSAAPQHISGPYFSAASLDHHPSSEKYISDPSIRFQVPETNAKSAAGQDDAFSNRQLNELAEQFESLRVHHREAMQSGMRTHQISNAADRSWSACGRIPIHSQFTLSAQQPESVSNPSLPVEASFLPLPAIREALSGSEVASMSSGSRSGLHSAMPSVNSIHGAVSAGVYEGLLRDNDSMQASPVEAKASTPLQGQTLASSLLGSSLQRPEAMSLVDASPPHLLTNTLLPQQGPPDSGLWDHMATSHWGQLTGK